MKILPVVAYDDALKVHRPFVPGSEAFDPLLTLVTNHQGNTLAVSAKGLYAGNQTLPPVIVVDPDGVDTLPTDLYVPTMTVKTLDYALSLLELYRPAYSSLFLKSGVTYALSRNRVLRNINLTITFFGDPKYNTANSYYLGSSIRSQYQSDQLKPVIISDVHQDVSSFWTCAGVEFVDSKVTLEGTRLNIPASPTTVGLQPAAYSVLSDMFRLTNSTLNLDGCYTNKLSPDSIFGVVGCTSGTVNRLTGYASVLAVVNSVLSAQGVDPVALANRAFFIKMLPGRPSADQRSDHYSLVPTALGPTPSSALLNLQWALTKSIADPIANSMSVSSFPDGSASYGIGHYIYGITRDLSRRPYNVRSNLPI